MTPPLAFNGNQIMVRAERISLTDMWRANGGEMSKRPVEWLRSKGAREFIEHLELMVGNSHLYETTAGKAGTTFAHWQIALAYAKYLSPEFHAWCNTVVRGHMEGDRRSGAEPGLDADARAVIGGIVKSVTERVISTTVPMLVQAELAGDRNRLVVDNLTVGEILNKEGVASKGRRGLVNRVARSLVKFSATEGIVPRRTHPGRSGTNVYQPELVQRWLTASGRALIAAHRADRPAATFDMFSGAGGKQVKP